MKKRFLLFAAVIAFTLSGISDIAMAQEIQPAQIISINSPISTELRQALDEWLLNSQPSPAVYYAVTYSQPIGFDTYATLVGLNILNPTDFWSLVGDKDGNQQVIWMDTVRVSEDGVVSPTFLEEKQSSYGWFKLAAPIELPLRGPGGSNTIRFPWQAGKSVQYGILGGHPAGYSGLGTDATWIAVDLLSGTDRGSGAANDKVYASASGTITAICDYGDTVAVRIDGGGNSLVYAHMLPNENLTMGHAFSRGELMGALKHGSFVDQCGYAVQQEDHWHLHWAFITQGENPRTFKAEGCIFTKFAAVTSGIWKCGNIEIKVLGVLNHYGNIGIDPDDGSVGIHLGEGAGGGPSFWDYLLPGAKSILDFLVFNNMPEHNSNLGVFANTIINSAKIVFRIAQVLIRGNINIAPAMAVVVFAISLRVGLYGLGLAGYIYRILRG